MREPSVPSLAASVAVVAVAVIGAVVLASGGTAAAEDADFDVSITVDSAVDANGELNVSVSVTNRGTAAGTQRLTLTDGEGNELDTTAVSLNASESTELQLTWSGVPGDARTVTPTVQSENDVEASVVTVRWSFFEVAELDPARTTVEAGERFGLSATVRNMGTTGGEQDVRLLVAGTEYAVKENVSIDGEEFAIVRFEGIEPELEPGTYSYTVETANESASGSLTVPQAPVFTITDLVGSYEAGTATVEAVVRNEGDLEGTQPVTFEVDGRVIDERTVTLVPGEGTDLSLEFQPESVPVNVTVTTEAPAAASARVGSANLEFGPRVRGVTPESVTVDDTIEVSYTAAGENLAGATLLVEGPDGAIVHEATVPGGTAAVHSVEQSALDPYPAGSYDVTLRVEDEFGRSDADTLTDAFSVDPEVTAGPAVERVAPEYLQVDNTLLINYTATGRNVDSVHILLTGPDGEVALDEAVPRGVDQQHAIDPSTIDGLEAGPYDVTVEIRDAFGGSESATLEEAFEAAPVYNPDDGNFAETTYTGVAGDFVRVDVSLNDVEDGYILFGEGTGDDAFEFGGPFDILHVSGSTSFLINTRLVGTDRPSEAVYIGADGSVTSYAHDLGPDAPPSGVFEDLRFETPGREQLAANLSAFRTRLGVSGQLRPLQPGEYTLALGGGDSIVFREDGIPDPRFPLDRATVELTAPALGPVETYRLPTGSADKRSFQLDGEQPELSPGDIGALLEQGVPSDRLALGDRLLVEFNATGMHGALLDSLAEPAAATGGTEPRLLTPAEFRAFLDRPEGIDLTVTHRNPGPNTRQTRIDLLDASGEEVSFLLDPYFGSGTTEMGPFYALVDTRPPEPFVSQPGDNETFRLNFSYRSVAGERYTFPTPERGTLPAPFTPRADQPGELYPYFDAGQTTVTRSTSFTIEQRFLAYNRTTADGKPIVTNTPGTTIAGQTNLAPGDSLPIRMVIDVRDEPITVEIEDVTIGPDGTFAATTDLSGIDPDDEVVIQFWAYQKLLDERELAVFDDVGQFSTFEIAELQTQSIVREDDGPVVNVTTTVANTGELGANATVELLIDGEVVDEQAKRIDRGDTAAFRFPEATAGLEPGTYTVEVRTADDLEGELVVVEEATTVFEVDAFSLGPNPTADPGAVTVSATVVNAGTVRGTAPVELLIDGEVVAGQNESLLVEEGAVFSFDEAVSDLDPGEYVLTVRTGDDEQSRPLVVEETSGDENSDGDDSTDGGESPGSDSSSEGGAGGAILGVGAGSRAVVGGTAVVGAVYVLGYWI